MSEEVSREKLLPHDRFIRDIFSHPEVAEEFFAQNLPTPLLPLVNLKTLKPCKESFVGEDLRMQSVDLLFSVEINARPGYIYTLVEHQSSPNPLMCLRVLKYMVRIQEEHLKRVHHETGKKPKTLPAVLPFVLYTGKKPWRSSMHFFDLFGLEKDLVTRLFMTTFPLLDVTALSEEGLEKPSLLNASLLAMKYIRQLRQNPKLLERIVENASFVEKQGKTDYASSIMTYVASVGDFNDKERLKELVMSTFTGEFAMNLLAQFEKDGLEKGRIEGLQTGLEKGRMEGLEKGVEKVALNLLEKGMSVEFIEEATGLSADRIQALRTVH